MLFRSIPSRSRPVTEFNVPGWNTYVAEKHDAAREAFLLWMDFGKPRFGHYFDNMKKPGLYLNWHCVIVEITLMR